MKFDKKDMIFLDVGSHIGQTLEPVVECNKFDLIYSFEPNKKNYNLLLNKFKKYNNIIFNNFGLSNKDDTVKLYDPENIGASIYSDKEDIDNLLFENIIIKKVSNWIKNNLDLNKKIFLKLNCEGSEYDILMDLIENNLISKIDYVMIDLDIIKIPSKTNLYNKALEIIYNLNNVDFCRDVMIGTTHYDRIMNWINLYTDLNSNCKREYTCICGSHFRKLHYFNSHKNICKKIKNKDITVVITSFNRVELLKKTLENFLKFNTYPIKKFIIIEDSGMKNINDFVYDLIDKSKILLIYNNKNIGQIASIDKAYTYVDTEYIFHLEEDWEFYKSGFIEQSLDILKNNIKIGLVWLIEYNNNKAVFSNHIIEEKIYDNKYKLLSSNHIGSKRKTPKSKREPVIWSGFTFNPSLRRLSDYNLMGPYLKKCIPYFFEKRCDELDIQKLFLENNFKAAITLHEEGFVKHIGYNNHIIRDWEL